MKDLMLIIPFFNDSAERLSNIIELTDILDTYKINYLIVEGMWPASIGLPFYKKSISYWYPEHSDKDFPKSTLINVGVSLAYSNYKDKFKDIKYLAWHDCDIRLHKSAYESAYDMLIGGAYFVRPYNGTFINIKGYRYNGKLYDNIGLIKETLHMDSCGGALFFDKEKFIEIGGMNENFKGWGFEDDELRSRIYKNNYEILYIASEECWHLDHPRGNGVSSQSNPHYNQNWQEYIKVNDMTLEELKKYSFSRFCKKK